MGVSSGDPGTGLLDRRGERAAVDRVLDRARAGNSAVLVVRGEPGIGKTVLLDYAASRASASDLRVVRAWGVESEMELAFAGLHQLCVPLLGRLEQLPKPQRDALEVAFGMREGQAPDRFLVGLAVLSLLAATAEDQPLACLVDDAQWLDRASVQCLAFAARRLLAEPVALIFAAREPGDDHELAGRHRARRCRRARGAGLGGRRAAGRAGGRPDRGGDPREPAGAAGTAARAGPRGAGGRVWPARRGAAGRPDRRQLRLPAGRPAGPDPAVAAAGGGRPVR